MIIAAGAWTPPRRHPHTIVGVRAVRDETALAWQMTAAGVPWNRHQQVWRVSYDLVVALMAVAKSLLHLHCCPERKVRAHIAVLPDLDTLKSVGCGLRWHWNAKRSSGPHLSGLQMM
jgi:hypothetical protein